MDFKEIAFLTLSSIKERKTRNVLTILMIIMGCGLLVSLSSLTQGLIVFVEQNFKKILPNQIIISNTDKLQQSSVDSIRNKLQVLFDQNVTLVDKRIPFDNKTLKYINSLKGIESVSPAYQGVVLLKYSTNSEITNVLATDMSNLSKIIPNLDTQQNKLNLKDGNFVIIPQKLGEKIFGKNEDEPISNRIVTIQNLKEITDLPQVFDSNSINKDNNFKVLAVVNSTGNPFVDNSIFIDIKKGKEILDKPNDYDILFLTYNDINKVDDIVKNIQKYFNNQVSILNSLEIIRTLTKFIIGISTFISSIAIFSLIVGSIGIVITIYTSVAERTREIGIIKALGGTNNTILGMFLTESIIIGIIGAGIGVLFGFFGSYILLNGFLFFLKIPVKIFPVFDLMDISRIVITVIGLSIFAGLYPAYKGSKISPVSALAKFF